MKCLITGGAGFIGSHLAERLIYDGHAVTVLDDLSTGKRSNLDAIASATEFQFIEGSVLDADLVEQLVQRAEVVFHLAAAVGVKLIMEEPSKSLRTNITGTENVLNAALPGKTLTLVASTSEVYGKAAKFPFNEDDDLILGATRNHRWSYACAKMLDEFLALAHARDSSLPVIILRFFNTTGPRQTGRYGMVVPRFVQSALDGEPLTVHGTGEQTRCFGHVFDVVEALVRLMSTPEAHGKVFNIGNDQEISIRALADYIISETQSSSNIQIIPYQDVYPDGFEDMMRRVPDISKLEQTIGFRPRRTLKHIVADLMAEKK
ncbi:NAD-dependent epimerase/dehydratase family protein [Pseudoruegeria sp. SK021]|uniref:NAD-dependent epimerase/dehydratase family protein n=1 Tax=Pseudoruegeria sp. SK021 TaxID=1933035 RepID=UPI000A235F9F|nr:NAD-dependent epimerase/dehydratase family protein [Pseudoruegeria sp. SK021]OSP55078.1 nucleoside-diphosphate sugar epimerase [Pseudoruegeria sp. SK021]